MNVFSIFSQMPLIKEKAPALIAGFLDELIKENRPKLDANNGEVQICYLMTQAPTPKGNHVYMISIVALSADDKILRILSSIPLSDALTTILSNVPNA